LFKTIDKGTQGRRCSKQDKVAGNYPHNGFGRKGSILGVGSAYLFEKPRSRVGKIPRFSDITDSNDDSAYNDDCDSSAYNAMKS
jgi:hypothetical protein